MFVLLLSLLSNLAPAQPVTIEQDRLEATGRQETTFSVEAFGRYAIEVDSAQGTALQLVDRMNGPGPLDGTPGTRDGRIDRFLDRGTYKVITRAHDKGEGEAQLSVTPFEEEGGASPVQWVDRNPHTTTLNDHAQRSWWVPVEEARTFRVEAAGRALADLRVWRDGGWLVDAEPTCRETHPDPQAPLTHCELVVQVEPGLYRFTAYGGPPLEWASGSDAMPLHVRKAVPRRPEAARSTHRMGPFGVERWVVPDATYFRLELPEARPASFSVRGWDPDRPFRGGGRSARITKESRRPEAVVRLGGKGERLVTVTAEPGQSYTLQHFAPLTRGRNLRGDGRRYFISVPKAGFPGDEADASAVLVHHGPKHHVLSASAAIPIDRAQPYRRRFNLDGTVRILLEVESSGRYDVRCDDCRFRLERFATTRPRDYEAPPYRSGEHRLRLEPGTWVMSLQSDDRRVVDLGIAAAGLIRDARGWAGLEEEETEHTPPRPVAQLVGVELDRDLRYRVHTGHQRGAPHGLILRAFPIDPRDPLPVMLGGEPVALELRAPEAGLLEARDPRGKRAELSVDGGAWQSAVSLPAGSHDVRLRHPDDGRHVVTLGLTPEAELAETPLPPLPPDALEALPDFPRVSADQPRFLDLDRQSDSTFAIRMDAPGLVQLESTGLLATRGRVRTRTITSFREDDQSGAGRNFRVETYLGEGDYQLTVATRGETQGRLGVKMKPTSLREGGSLQPGRPARAALEAGEGIAYEFEIEARGRYALRSFGPGGTYRMRLEDADGWPILRPGGDADLTRELRPGRYRMVLLPEPRPNRRLTLLEHLPEVEEREGTGPHAVALDEQARRTWREPDPDQQRAPDVWTFEMPAPAQVTLEATGDMAGPLYRGDERVARLVPGRPLEVDLDAGPHRLELKQARRSDRVPYTLKVSPTPLVEGITRQIRAPATLEVSVGRPQLVELSSFGADDVRARLIDDAGRVVAQADDRPEDWNFQLVERVEAGDYRLEVEPVGSERARTQVRMQGPAEAEAEPLSLPADETLTLDGQVRSFALPDNSSGLVVVQASAAENIGAAIEQRQGAHWRTVTEDVGREVKIAFRPGEGAHRLRVWSLDYRGQPVDLQARSLEPRTLRERALRRGRAVTPQAGLELAAVQADLDGPGAFQVDPKGLWVCPQPAAPCTPPETHLLALPRNPWFLTRVEGRRGQLQAQRHVLEPGEISRLRFDENATVDVASNGPVLLRAEGAEPVAAWLQTDEGHPVMGRVPDGVVAADLGEGSRSVQLRTPRSVDARLELFSFDAPDIRAADDGPHEARLEPGEARAWRVPASSAVQLSLPPGLVAATTDEGAPTGVHAAAGRGRAVELGSRLDGLWVFNPTHAPLSVGFQVTPGPVPELFLVPGSPLERQVATAGTRIIEVPAVEGGTVRVRGAVQQAALVQPDGRVRRGRDLPADLGGRLHVHLDSGDLHAWLERPGEGAMSRFGAEHSVPAVPASLFGRIPLSAPVTRLWVPSPGDGLLEIHAPAEVMVALVVGDRAEVGLDGRLSVPVPEGQVEIWARPTMGRALEGHLDLTFREAPPLEEGLGPEVILAPGQTRLFSVDVPKAGLLGVGVRSDSDAPVTVLYEPSGHPVGRGVVQMADVTAGRWLLGLQLPADADPVQARPAVVGLDRPDTGPPEDVIRKYLEEAGLSPAKVSP